VQRAHGAAAARGRALDPEHRPRGHRHRGGRPPRVDGAEAAVDELERA
jgi:hypothetical protein